MPIEKWKTFIARCMNHQASAAEMLAWQQAALREVLLHVTRRSPFYRRRLAQVDVASVTLENLAELPFTTKQDLGEAMYDMVCGDLRDGLFFFSTTGTTGRSTPCPRSHLDFDVDNAPITASLGKVLKAWLPADEKPVLAMICPNETHSVCLSISSAARELGILKLDAFPLSPVVGFERLFDLLLELQVNVVVASPGLLMALAEMSQAYGIDVKQDLNVRCVLTTGELCTPSMAQLIEDTWGARACNWWYGSQEAGSSALADPEGLMRPVQTNHILEVLDVETGRASLNQGRGELVLTTLIPGMKPLIRYRTGDFVELTSDAAGQPVLSLLGRLKDRVRLAGVLRSAAEIETAVLGEHRLIYGYQLEIAELNEADLLTVRVKPREGADFEAVRRAVGDRVRVQLGVECKVEIVPLLDMVTATGGWISWKTARIKDARVDESRGIEARSASLLSQVALERV